MSTIDLSQIVSTNNCRSQKGFVTYASTRNCVCYIHSAAAALCFGRQVSKTKLSPCSSQRAWLLQASVLSPRKRLRAGRAFLQGNRSRACFYGQAIQKSEAADATVSHQDEASLVATCSASFLNGRRRRCSSTLFSSFLSTKRRRNNANFMNFVFSVSHVRSVSWSSMEVLWSSWRFQSLLVHFLNFELILRTSNPKEGKFTNFQTALSFEGNSERHLRELSHLQFFFHPSSHIWWHLSPTKTIWNRQKWWKFRLSKTPFFTLLWAPSDSLPLKISISGLKRLFYGVFDRHKFFHHFSPFEKLIWTSVFGIHFEIRGISENEKDSFERVPPAKLLQLDFRNSKGRKKTKIYWFALKPPKLPEGPSGRHLRGECFRTIQATLAMRPVEPSAQSCYICNLCRWICTSPAALVPDSLQITGSLHRWVTDSIHPGNCHLEGLSDKSTWAASFGG